MPSGSEITSLTGAGFLHRKYRGFSNSPEVESAARRHQRQTGEELKPQQPEDRIQAYLDRVKAILEPEATNRKSAPERRRRNIDMLKRMLHRQFVITPDQVPESYFDSISERQRREGRPVYYDDDSQPRYDIPDQQRSELIEALIEDQQNSLDEWVDYLTSPDAKYPDHLKYWVFRSMLGMSTYDKKKQAFGERGKGSVNPFPELNRQALSLAIGAVEKLHTGGDITEDIGYGLEEEQMSQFQQAVQQENFPKIYGWLVEQFKPIDKKLLETTAGEWKTYPAGSEPTELVADLKDYGTGWCIRSTATARRYLQGDQSSPGNDLLVYYSNNEEGEPRIPRCVIVMCDGIISEVRGIAPKENTDDHINEVVRAKLEEIPDGARYIKRTDDMQRLSAIEDKAKAGKTLNQAELTFLYEIEAPIEWFGYGEPHRVAELRQGRNIQADMLVIFDCTAEQVAHNQTEINEDTKAYIGEWSVEVFQIIKNHPNIQHLYESFPDQRIFMRTLETDPNIDSPQSAIDELQRKNIDLSDEGNDILYQTEFSRQKKQYKLVRFTVGQLGFSRVPTTNEIYRRAQELGLELCPAEVGPHLRLQYSGKEWMLIAMEPIAVRNGDPPLFSLDSNNRKLKLYGYYARPHYRWFLDRKFVFRFRPPATPKASDGRQSS